MRKPRNLHQTTLTASADHILVVDKSRLHVKPSSDGIPLTVKPSCDGPPLILRLPDELLDRILDLSCPPVTEYIRSLATYRDAQTLMLVCQRFHQIARPILYRGIKSGYRSEFVPPSKKARLLHRTLRENQSLWVHCNELFVRVPDISGGKRTDDSLNIINDFLSWLTNVRSFSMYGGFNLDPVGTWALIHKAIETMHRLEELHLHREYWGLTAERLYDIPQNPSLTTLVVSGISSDRYGSNDGRKFRASMV